MPCAARELCLILDRTPQRPDGDECRGKCGGRLDGFCGEADPDCDNPMQRVCHDCLAAKQSAKDVSGKHKAGKRKVADTGGGGAGPWKSAKSGTAKSNKPDMSGPRTRLTNAQKVEVLQLLDQKVSHAVIADGFGCGPRTVSRIAQEKVSITKLAASASSKAINSKSNRSADTTTTYGVGAPPPYAELSPPFNLLESAAGACGNGDAAFYLQKARMSFIKAHASKPVRQADMREFCGEGGSTAE